MQMQMKKRKEKKKEKKKSTVGGKKINQKECHRKLERSYLRVITNELETVLLCSRMHGLANEVFVE